jgi:REP element-mobilizing transposase RayT
VSRPLRLEFSGALYHITARGNRQEDIFEDDGDREKFLSILEEVCERFNCICHAYCLMSNHYHLIIETPDANLSKGMRQLNGVYTQSFNRAHNRVGHVFQGRYKAINVEKDSYLLELSRYIVLNPVRAKMARTARDWRWSSYRAMIGQVNKPEFLETDWVLSAFAKRKSKAIAAYKKLYRKVKTSRHSENL